MKTTGTPAQLLLSVDRPMIRADGLDLAYITVAVADREGLTVPRSHNLVQFEVEGPGEIVAVGNGDATSHEPFQARQRKAYNGLCQVIVKGRSGQPGAIMLTAKSEGLTGAVFLVTQQVAARRRARFDGRGGWLLHRHDGLHRLQGVRGGLPPVERAAGPERGRGAAVAA